MVLEGMDAQGFVVEKPTLLFFFTSFEASNRVVSIFCACAAEEAQGLIVPAWEA